MKKEIEILTTLLESVFEVKQQAITQVMTYCALDIIIKDVIIKLSERQEIIEANKQHDSKALHIADVVRF